MSAIKDGATRVVGQTFGRPIPRSVLRPLAQRGLVPDRVWKRVPVEAPFRVACGADGFTYRPSAGDRIGRRLFWRPLSTYESGTMDVFLGYAGRAGVFVDVGACTGLFTLAATSVNPDLRVVALEPVPRNHRRLVEHLALNGVDDRCRALRAAAGAAVGTASFFVPAGAEVPQEGSLAPPTAATVDRITVDVTTVDLAVADVGRVDVVKIDVEGGEAAVLAGMETTLERDGPAIFAEFLESGSYEAAQAILDRHGYTYRRLDPAGPVPVDRLSPAPGARVRNYLCEVR